MKKGFLLTHICLVFSLASLSQSTFSSNPDSSVFLTRDVDNFWKAFDAFQNDSTQNPFEKNYLAIGSAGVKGFTPYRIESAAHLYEVVKKRRADYVAVRPNTLRIKEMEKQCRSAFYALKYWYAQAQFPPVYFVVGAYNSGGTSGPAGLMIGAEMQTNVSNIPYLVAHELIHFQQKNWRENPTLLEQSIVEGSADFLGELICGVNINKGANEYGNKHQERLCKEFVRRMDSTNFKDWLYGVYGKDDRPNDLGYWMGYKIAERYFAQAADKKKAIAEILDIKNAKAFLAKSGYLKPYL